jgi:hypothetical protein
MEPVAPAMDVFALAATLYYLLTGRFPYFPKRSSRAPAFDRPLLPASAAKPMVPLELDAILAKALDMHPERRFPGVGELREAVMRHYAGRTKLDTAPLVAPSPATGKPAKKAAPAPPAGKREAAPSAPPMPYAVPPYVPPAPTHGTFWDFVGWALGIVACMFVMAILIDACQRHREVGTVYVPAAVAQDVGESIVRILSWPAAKVFVNGRLLSEAPSLDDVVCPSGSTSFRIISKTGKEHSFSAWLTPGKTYEVHTDLDNSTHSVQEAGR